MHDDDSEYDPDFVVSFDQAQDDEAADDAARHATTGAGGCLQVLAVAALSIAVVLIASTRF